MEIIEKGFETVLSIDGEREVVVLAPGTGIAETEQN